MKISHGTGRFSPKVLQNAIMLFYTHCNLFPRGITGDMDAIQLWSLKMGRALCRMVSCLNRWLVRGGIASGFPSSFLDNSWLASKPRSPDFVA